MFRIPRYLGRVALSLFLLLPCYFGLLFLTTHVGTLFGLTPGQALSVRRIVPLVFMTMFVFVASRGVAGIRRARRYGYSVCTHCTYPLGASGRCSECGFEITREQAARSWRSSNLTRLMFPGDFTGASGGERQSIGVVILGRLMCLMSAIAFFGVGILSLAPQPPPNFAMELSWRDLVPGSASQQLAFILIAVALSALVVTRTLIGWKKACRGLGAQVPGPAGDASAPARAKVEGDTPTGAHP